jgi:hypothetical protein
MTPEVTKTVLNKITFHRLHLLRIGHLRLSRSIKNAKLGITVGLAVGALAKTIGNAKADKTIPVVKKAQASFKAEDAFMSSVNRLEMIVGSGARK